MLEQKASRSEAAERRRVLLLCDFDCRHIGTISDHLAAFKTYSENEICIVDARSSVRANIAFDEFDALVVHYSVTISAAKLPEQVAAKIRGYRGYKIAFIQDEYRWVDATAAAIADLGIYLIYSVVNEQVIDAIYHHEAIRGVRRRHTLTGFVSDALTTVPVPEYERRPIDVGYRARKLPMWLGSFGQEKWIIGERFKRDAVRYGLVCDIEHDESKRIYGGGWTAFLSNCKAVLGTESGASFIDFSGEVQLAVEAFEQVDPDARFEEVQARFLGARDGETVIQVISPRCFEAAALRTLMILYPGPYSGVLEPWRHYVPLERDHGNMDEVVAVLRDPDRARRIIDNAYREIALNPLYGFRTMVEDFDRDIAERVPVQNRVAVKEVARVEREVERRYRIRRLVHSVIYGVASPSVHWLLRSLLSERKYNLVRQRIRALLRPWRMP